MKDGFVKVAAVTPLIRVADTKFNAKAIADAINAAADKGAKLVVLPELCVCGYTAGDLLLQDTLIRGCAQALFDIAKATQKAECVSVVGAPIVRGGKLYDCAVAISKGNILGVTPKTYIPNYGEFYELRHFTPYNGSGDMSVPLIGSNIKADAPFGYIVYKCEDMPTFTFAAEVCEDLWAGVSPSAALCAAGANIIVNPSASDEVVGKAEYRKMLVSAQSGKQICGYVYCDAGEGESVTDTVFSGHNIIAECGAVISECAPFSGGIAISEIDTQKIAFERRRINTFTNAGNACEVYFNLKIEPCTLTRNISPSPFIPSDNNLLKSRCDSVLRIQAEALARRLRHTGGKSVIGISGGLDSALALIVAVKATDIIGGDRKDITAVTMPCYGTTKRTKSNAELLSNALGVNFMQINIGGAVDVHLADIGHDKSVTDVTFENAQARERTQVLMDIANKSGGIVVGTGDLSELALGWATYNGDHMSMYGVNAGVPKTLIRHIVRHYADICGNKGAAAALYDILDTPVSPELLPAVDGKISQRTEELVGPYELHDFFIYYTLRFGFSPSKIFSLAKRAFGNYDEETILKWLKNFYKRFFAQQFKRSCMPDGPKVGSVTLSPRGDWRMPSDAHAKLWMDELDNIKL
ncbi:MAG: NAD(+) synthase [Clostridia bacterium]|nr:NAD(+) synthase [Clostridia bacterium]